MDPRKNSLSKNSLSNFSHTNASSSSLPAGDGDGDGEALVDGETDGIVNGRWKKDGHGRDASNRAVRDGEEEETGLSVPAENADLPPAEGIPRVSMGEAGLSTTKGGEIGAETVTTDLEVGGGASSKVDNGGPSSSSSFNLDEFLKLANRVIDQDDDVSMAALRDLQIRWKTRFGDGGNRAVTPMVARGQERLATGKLLKARRCLLPCIAGQTAVGNGGETAAKVQLPTAAAACGSSSETGGNGGISGRAMSAGGRKAAANVSVAAGSPCAFFRRVGERPVTFSATGVAAGADVCRKDDVDGYVDTTGGDVAAEVGDMDAEVEIERVADISPSRADIIAAARADIITDVRADIIAAARADIIAAARADIIAASRADIIAASRADIIDAARADIIADTGASRADVSNYTIKARADIIDDTRKARADINTDTCKNRADVSNSVERNQAMHDAPLPTGLYVGNIPLHAYPDTIIDDKIAHAFNHSTRKTLSFIAPTMQNGEVVVRPSLDAVRNGSKRWKSTAVGYFLGKRPYYHHLKEFAHSVWPALREVTATTNGFFFFQFKTVFDMEEIIEGGPWLFQGQPIVLQKWEPGMAMRKLKHTQVPVWIKLRHLPMEFWTTEGLSTVASGVGKPLYPDAITRACTRLDFARVCVMIDATQKLHKHIIVMAPDEEGGETPCKVDIEYEWLPPKCTACMSLGHSNKDCALNKTRKPTKPTVNVYVPKVNVAQPQLPTKGRETMKPVVEEIPKAHAGNRHVDQNHSKQEERGKAIVIYNAFDALHLIDDAGEHSGGPNTSSPKVDDPYHQLALKDLVSEYRLHFLGILETRVRLNNVMHIQSFLLPHWKWFVDYSSVGNRIWIAWDENIVDVHILDSADQFIHCRVTNMADNESVIITVVYGASEVIDRRNLWTALETLSQQCSDIPWMVGGDFNAVRDLNEVCGISGDIRMATEEFNAGILEAGLIPLPMQGEWFTWHNCSTSMRSLWKRLDRILINDRWLARFPSAYYHSLTPRTSDHSPLVLHGDIQQHNGGMFRFDNYLAHSPEFIHNVQNIWHHEIVGIPMYAVTRKLKALKPVFRLQRRNKGDLTMNVQLAKGFLDEAQQLVSADRQNELYLLLEHCCRVVYAKAAKLEQIMLQQRAKMQWMKDGDQCSRVFFRKIAQRRVRRRILQINDENGFTHTDLGEIAHEFVSYYQNLLGGTRRRLSVDIRYLRPWARHCITDEEANQLLLPISADDVKQAMFDIADDKAPGPDGYSSRFFQGGLACGWGRSYKGGTRLLFYRKTSEAGQLHDLGPDPKGTYAYVG
ncbi:UNVERIFIED_CONTAM: hypothetical protein Sindi_3035600 [Sesamum indicum]